MLVIRLSRTGRKKQASYRLVVAEHSAPIQGKFTEIVGHYNVTEGKKFVYDMEKINYWISVGAKPSDTVASLLKYNGESGMDAYIGRRNIKRKKKNAPDEEEEVAAAPAPAEGGDDAPDEETPPAEKAEEPAVE